MAKPNPWGSTQHTQAAENKRSNQGLACGREGEWVAVPWAGGLRTGPHLGMGRLTPATMIFVGS